MTSNTQCTFNGCRGRILAPLNKCAFHKNRVQCKWPNCHNQVYARYLCVRHGGKKLCAESNCKSYARGGAYCSKHGGNVCKRFCDFEGCSKQAHANGKCVRHGGGRYCRIDGCSQHIRVSGLCNRHHLETQDAYPVVSLDPIQPWEIEISTTEWLDEDQSFLDTILATNPTQTFEVSDQLWLMQI